MNEKMRVWRLSSVGWLAAVVPVVLVLATGCPTAQPTDGNVNDNVDGGGPAERG
jgi:hypothetical protein